MNMIASAEEALAWLPGSRLSSCALDVTQRCRCFRDDPSDRIRLRYGTMNNLRGECLHLEVSDENDEVFYRVNLRDEAIPVTVREAVVRQLPLFLANVP